jgi:WD40 repeat protein
VVSPDGRWEVVVHDDREVRLEDLASGVLRTLSTQGQVWAVAVSPDGAWLAAGRADGVLEIWDVATGVRRAGWPGHDGPVHAVAVSPDGAWLASCGNDRAVRVWDLTTWQALALMRVEGAALACAWSPDGGSLVVGAGVGLFVFDFHPGRQGDRVLPP